MPKSLLFIPDISGFTHFVQNTEIEHSQHVISELLETLINANTQNLQLAEIEGDALFFYKENTILSQEMLLAQMENMFTAFYTHLKILEKNRICTCNACATAPNLQLKIIAHAGELQFIDVKGNHKPFGNSVIEAHRLLKNSVNSDNYVLISDNLMEGIEIPMNYKSKLYHFQEGKDVYDSNEINYFYSKIDTSNLQINSFEEPTYISFISPPNLTFEKEFQVSSTNLLEYITNYKYRHHWVDGVDEFIYDENEVTRYGSQHVCVINGKHLDFVTVTKKGKSNQIVYGELTESPSPVDQLYQFYIITPISEQKCLLEVEVYLNAKSLLKKLLIALVVKNVFKKNTKAALDKLALFVEKMENLNSKPLKK